ncbi:hypothetical protein GCM10009841_34030 [Microlunatus panaciterrae]|uniref:Uncharacterized protein n=1 Tax=Microlunatus panaciterrae TaxID=400768 RepID=A0ABS2RGG6_9ACTN|nr:hypothetical protein [Microlunatus panaciterrae]MBM7798062.1 hypothetical protein [Microlunatus panaciterrae]
MPIFRPLDASTPGGEPPNLDEAAEVMLTGQTLKRLLADGSALPELEEAMHTGDTRAFAAALERNGVLDQLALICRWVCSWHVQRRCFWVCRDHDLEEMSLEEARQATLGFAKLAEVDGVLEKLIDAVDSADGDVFNKLLDRFGLGRYCRFICVLILTVRCELFCLRLQPRGEKEKPRDLVAVIRDVARATAAVAEDDNGLESAVNAYMSGNFEVIHRLLEAKDVFRFCRLVCWWFCVLIPYLRCVRVCRALGPIDVGRIPRPGDPGPIRQWAEVVASLAADRQQVDELLAPVFAFEDDKFLEAVRRHDLRLWCHYVCFWFYRLRCHRNCFLICPPRPPLPLFYRLGEYDFPAEVDSAAGGSGLTLPTGLDGQRAFFATVRLNGSELQKQYNGGGPEYRFEVNTGAGWTPVLGGQIAPTAIGSWTRAGLLTPQMYVVNSTGAPNEIPVVVKPGGWIEVPTANNYWGAEGYFSSNGNYIMFDTTTVVAATPHDASSVDAGEAVPSSELGADHTIGLRMRWRKVGDTTDGLIVGTADTVAVSNDRWNLVSKGGKWLPSRVNGQLAVVSLDIDELGAGCADITDQLHVRYTASHPNLGVVSLDLQGPGGLTLTMVNDASSTPDNTFGVAEITAPKTASDLPRCSYIAKLSATLMLTDGDHVPDAVRDEIAFHKA